MSEIPDELSAMVETAESFSLDLSSVRSVLCVPADREDWIVSADKHGADLVMIDLEDGIDPANRQQARANVREYAGPFSAVRVNSPDSPHHVGDMWAAINASVIFVSKIESVENLPNFPRLILLIESPAGIRNVLPRVHEFPDVIGLGFGRADFIASVGLGATALVDRAAEEIAMTCAALGLHATDAPCYVLDSYKQLEYETGISRRQGFHSKACFHPNQIKTVNRLMRPSQTERQLARDILRDETPGISRGSVGIISPPVLKLARRIAECE